MANFGNLIGKKQAQRAAKFIKYITNKLNRVSRLPESKISASVISAASKFLSSFGPRVARLNKASLQQLRNMDSEETALLRNQAIELLQANTAQRLKDVLEIFSKGDISIQSFTATIKEILRVNALSAAIIGVGGVGNLTENVLTATQRTLTQQFKLLDGFIKDISTRDIGPKDINRLVKFSQIAYSMSVNALRQYTLDTTEDEDLEEARFTEPGVENCRDCEAYESLGWVDVGTLPPIGYGTVCGTHCHCRLVVEPKSAHQDNTDKTVQ